MDLHELYERYFSQIYNYIFFKVLHRERAEDLVGEVFLKVVRNIDRFDPEKASLKTWIYTIASNTVIDFYRTNREARSLDEEGGLMPCVDFEEQFDLIRDENRRLLYTALCGLDDREREILSLRYNSELGVKEIAALLGMNESTVSTVHVRSLKKLRARLGEDFYAGVS